jgi:hypothetical protein
MTNPELIVRLEAALEPLGVKVTGPSPDEMHRHLVAGGNTVKDDCHRDQWNAFAPFVDVYITREVREVGGVEHWSARLNEKPLPLGEDPIGVVVELFSVGG